MVRLVKRQQGSARYYGFEEFEALMAAARQISPTAVLVVLLPGTVQGIDRVRQTSRN